MTARWVLQCAFVAAASMVVTACEHPIAIVTPHIEAADVLMADSSGTLISKTEFNRKWITDSIVLVDGSPRTVILTPLDFRGSPIVVAARTDISFRMEAEHPELLQWEPQRGFGYIRPFGAGETRVRFLIWHETHADFVTPWLRAVVRPASSPLSDEVR